jgi:hypothetical protein
MINLRAAETCQRWFCFDEGATVGDKGTCVWPNRRAAHWREPGSEWNKRSEPIMRDGIIIQEQACPRCAIRRTARLAYGTSFCFNCRLQWPTHDAPQLPRRAGSARRAWRRRQPRDHPPVVHDIRGHLRRRAASTTRASWRQVASGRGGAEDPRQTPLAMASRRSARRRTGYPGPGTTRSNSRRAFLASGA